MMKRKMGWVVLGVFAVGLMGGIQAFSGTSGNEDMCIPMGVIALKAPDEVKSQRSEVKFPHARHFEISCVSCHHTWGFTEPIVGCMSSGCHDEVQAPKKKPGEKADAGGSITYFKNAYHKLCINCHKQIKVKNMELQKSLAGLNKKLPKTGPVSCLECHPK